MKILILTKRQYMGKDLLDDRFGRFRELPLELAKLGHEVRGVCLSYRTRPEGLVEDSNAGSSAKVSWLSLNLGPLMLPELVTYGLRIKKLFKDFRPDIVWACSDAFHVVFGVWLAHLFNAKCVADLYDHFEAFTATRRTGILPLFKRAVRNADGVTCFSRRLAAWIGRHYQPGAKTVVVENGVRTDLFYPRERAACRRILGLPVQAKIIGTAGALYSNRGIDTLFRGFDLLAAHENNIHLAIAGPRHRSVRIPSGPNVRDLGILPWNQVPWLFNALDVAVSCYADSDLGRYSFPQKAYEIIACRTPIAAAAVGTMMDLLSSHPECLFEPGSPGSLAGVVSAQLENPTKIELKVPSWADTGKELEQFFSDTVAGRVSTTA